MEKIEWGPNWEEILGGEFAKRSADVNFEGVQKEIYGQFENTFMMYLPRLCEHCLNPACVAACPSGAIYKREEDGIVLIDQDKCRGWRMCVSGCPYKKIYYNWSSGKSEKCIFCYPRIEAGQPTVCSETCVGRIRYLGVVLYDADRIEEGGERRRRAGPLPGAARHLPRSERSGGDRPGARRRRAGEPGWRRAKHSPIWKMAMEWKVAFPLHPEYRTLPMVWYVPPLSPIQSAAAAGKIGSDGEMPDVRSLRIPLKYLANLLTAGNEEPVALGARAHARHARLHAGEDRRRRASTRASPARVGLAGSQIEEMYQIMAIANYEDRFVIPTAHRELGEDAYDLRGSCGFSFGNGCSDGTTETNLFGTPKRAKTPDGGGVMAADLQGALGPALLSDDGAAGRRPARSRRRSPPRALAVAGAARRSSSALIDEIAAGDLYDLQERYVLLFDRTRSLSLHLFEHVHGESRDRGQAMVDLQSLYERHGLEISATELPDFLPLFLEFLSTRAAGRGAASCSARPAHILAALAERLAQAQVALRGGLPRARAGSPPPTPTRREATRCWQEPDADPQRSRRARCRLGGRAGHLRSRRRRLQGRAGRPHARRPPLRRKRPRRREETLMRDAINHAVFGWYPYLCLTVFLLGSLVRFDREQYTWRTGSSQLLRRRQLMWGSNLFHVGILVIFVGHFVGLLTPIWVFDTLGMPHGFKQMTGDRRRRRRRHLLLRRHRAADAPPAVRSAHPPHLLVRRHRDPAHAVRPADARPRHHPGLAQHLDGHEMVKFMTWAQGILTLQSGVLALVADVHPIFKLHLFLGMTIFLVFPFTRLVHVWSAPIWYLGRRGYQIVRSRGPAGVRAPPAAVPAE